MSHESRVSDRIRLDLASVPGLRLFPNPIGKFWTGRLISMHDGRATIDGAHMVKCGLAPGSPDLIGWQMVQVGDIWVARFVGLEIKDEGRPTPAQLNFIEFLNSQGGAAGVAHNTAEALEIINRPFKAA